MSGYRGRRPSNRHREPRWLALRYPAQCKVCRRMIPVGEHAFYDYGRRTATCHDMPCCEADGLTSDEWHGSPVSGRYVPARRESRIGAGYVRDPGEDAADRWAEAH